MRVSAAPSAAFGLILSWAGLSLIGVALLDVAVVPAVLGGLVAALLHYFSAFWHQLGHAWVARRIGFPMSGVRFWWLLSASLYPADEPDLPAAIHIRRALGGPPASLLLAMAAAALLLPLRSGGGLPYYLALFLCLDNLLVFTLGALLPLGFTDGSTLLRWRARQ